MSYNEFDINSAIAPTVSRESYKLAGFSDVAKIYNSKSTSTEEFISGAIHNLGAVNRNVMYVHSSLSGLRDRLAIATKVAKNVNAAKDRGFESFSNVSKMDPWEYALEDGNQNFFQKVWAAIMSACRRLVAAIANIIKHIQIFITKADTKKASADLAYYKRNKAVIDVNAKKNKTLSTKFNAMDWAVDAGKLSKVVAEASSTYTTAFNGAFGSGGDGKILENLANTDISQAKDLAGFKAVSKKIFGGLFTFNDEMSAGHFTSEVQSFIKKIEAPQAAMIKKAGLGSVTTTPSASTVAHKLVYNKEGKVVQVTVEKMRKASDNWAVLEDGWLAKNVTAHVTSLNNAVRTFTKYTKAVDKAAAQFKKVAVDSTKAASLKTLSNICSQLSNARIRTNSWFTSLMLELELCALRFRKNAHTSLVLYMRGKAAAPAKKSSESLDTNMLFSF